MHITQFSHRHSSLTSSQSSTRCQANAVTVLLVVTGIVHSLARCRGGHWHKTGFPTVGKLPAAGSHMQMVGWRAGEAVSGVMFVLSVAGGDVGEGWGCRGGEKVRYTPPKAACIPLVYNIKGIVCLSSLITRPLPPRGAQSAKRF